jgi:hypothetical protein
MLVIIECFADSFKKLFGTVRLGQHGPFLFVGTLGLFGRFRIASTEQDR